MTQETVIFTVDNVLTHVTNPHLIREAIDQYLLINRDSFEKRVDWEQFRATGDTVVKTFYKKDTLNVYNPIKCTFPTGRAGYIMQYCHENNIPWEMVDNRVMPQKHLEIKYTGPPSDGSNGLPPRPYQTNSTDVVKTHKGRGILWHPTASGKTVTGAHLIADFGVNTLYLVPSIELLNQTSQDLKDVLDGVEIGTIGDGSWDPKPITVATAQTLWKRFERPECKDFLKQTEMLIVDEAHHISRRSLTREEKKRGEGNRVNTWYIIALNCNAYYRIGLTGTPGKDIEQKRALLECAIGRVIDRVTMKELIDLGILSDVQVNIHTIKHAVTHYEYHIARKEGVLFNDKFNEYVAAIAITELKAKRSVLLLTSSKKWQGPTLAKLFKRQGYEVPFVSGDDNRKTRIKAREDFRDGKIKCLIGTVYKEGVNFPKCDCGILCDGFKDEKATIQFLGRILRSHKGKAIAHLHDFLHKDKKHLKKHSNARISTYFEEELDKIVMHEGIEV